MQKYNLIVVYSHDLSHILLCRRKKEPYLGLSNFIGGHIEQGESGTDAAYRELYEETSISRGDIKLTHLMDFNYYLGDGCLLEVYFGRLNSSVAVHGDENELYWADADCNFFDTSKYAGTGNMGHIIEEIKLTGWEILENTELDF